MSGRARLSRPLLDRYLAGLGRSSRRRQIGAISRFSMLHTDTLALLRACGLEARQGILEIGAYVGGSTCAIALAQSDRERAMGATPLPFLTVDIGGEYSAQPYLPSKDIHADWQANVARFGLTRFTRLYGGWASDPSAARAASAVFGPDGKIDLVFLDANGEFWPNLGLFAHRFTLDCLLVLDDYHNVEGVQDKALGMRRAVADLRSHGAIAEYGEVRWSTLFARLGPGFPAVLEAARQRGFQDVPA
jgi:predicted O-methyltransferase YrrM